MSLNSSSLQNTFPRTWYRKGRGEERERERERSYIQSVSSFVHQIKLCHHPKRSFTCVQVINISECDKLTVQTGQKQGKWFTLTRRHGIPCGSTSRASLIASDVAISWLAGDIASMMLFGYNSTKSFNQDTNDVHHAKNKME